MAPVLAHAPGPTNVVIVSKIPEGTNEQQLTAGAGRPGDVLQVSFRPADPDGPGWAFITLASPELAKVAKERLDGKPLLGSSVAVPLEAVLGEGLFGNIRSVGDQDSLWREARTPQGQVYYYHVMTRQTTWIRPPPEFPSASQSGRAHGFTPGGGYGMGGGSAPSIASYNPAAQAVIQAAQAAAAASQATAASADASGGGGGANASGPVGANLFVYHIPNSWDDGILRQHFEHFGRIVSCRVQKDPEGRPRGFGFVSYDAPGAAQAAIAGMHGFPVEGKWLKVQLKKGDEQQLDKAPGDLSAGVQTRTPPPPPGISSSFGAALPPRPPGATARSGPY